MKNHRPHRLNPETGTRDTERSRAISRVERRKVRQYMKAATSDIDVAEGHAEPIGNVRPAWWYSGKRICFGLQGGCASLFVKV